MLLNSDLVDVSELEDVSFELLAGNKELDFGKDKLSIIEVGELLDTDALIWEVTLDEELNDFNRDSLSILEEDDELFSVEEVSRSDERDKLPVLEDTIVLEDLIEVTEELLTLLEDSGIC